jgi:uncharacterized protein YndB with AHSA1/START domain
MSDQSAIHNTFVIERTYPKPVEKVFHAFADATAKRQWYTPGTQHDLEKFDMDFRPGGAEHMSYRFNKTSPFPGSVISNETTFCDIVPNQRIVTSSTMSFDDRRVSVSLITLEFVPAGEGATLICTHQGVFFEGSGGAELREAGWRTLFESLAADLAK